MSGFRHKCWVKATDREHGAPRYSASWVGARRAWFKVFDDHVECGDWMIPVTSVREAVLFEARMWFVVPVYVLEIVADRGAYQFGFNPWCRIAKHLPFEAEHRRVKLAFSAVSMVVRAVFLGLLAYALWRRLA